MRLCSCQGDAFPLVMPQKVREGTLDGVFTLNHKVLHPTSYAACMSLSGAHMACCFFQRVVSPRRVRVSGKAVVSCRPWTGQSRQGLDAAPSKVVVDNFPEKVFPLPSLVRVAQLQNPRAIWPSLAIMSHPDPLWGNNAGGLHASVLLPGRRLPPWHAARSAKRHLRRRFPVEP